MAAIRVKTISLWLRLVGSLACTVAFAQQPAVPAPMLLIPSAHRPGLGGGIKVLAVNPLSSWFATLGADETICIWNASDAHFLAKTSAKGVQALAILPHSHQGIEGDNNGNVRLVDFDSLTTIRSVKLDGSVRWLQATADGRIFAVTFNTLYRLDPLTLAATRLATPDSGVFFQSAAIDENGTVIGVTMLGGDNVSGRAVLFNPRDGTVLLRKDLPRITSLAVSNDLVAIGSRDSDEFNVLTGHILVLHTPDGTVENNIAVKNTPWSLILTNDGGQPGVVSGFSGGVERISLATIQTVEKGGPGEAISQLSRSGSLLIAAGSGGAPSLCDPATLRCTSPPVVQSAGATQAKMLADGSLLLMDTKGESLRIKETVLTNKVLLSSALALIPTFKGRKGVFATNGSSANDPIAPTTYGDLVLLREAGSPLAVSADGHYLAARAIAAAGKQISVDIDDLSKITRDAGSLAPKIASWKLSSEEQYVADASNEFEFGFTPDSRLLIAVDMQTGSVHRFEVASGRELFPVLNPLGPQQPLVIGASFVSAWAMGENGRQLVRAQYRSLQIIELDGGAGSGPVAVNSDIRSIVAGDDGMWFVAMDDGIILRWNGKNQLAPFATLPYSCASLLYIPQRKWLVADSADGSIRFVDAATGRLQMSLAVFSNGKDWLLWTPEGLFDASDRGWQRVQWKFGKNTFSASEPMEDYRNDFYYPGLAAAVLAGIPLKPPTLRVKDRSAPTVRVTASQPSPAGKVTVDVVVTATAGVAIRDVHLSRNGVLLKIWSGTQRSGSHFSFTTDLVAGKNQFTGYAFNEDNVKSTDVVTEVTGPESLARAGELYVVAIGINDYRNHAFHLNYARQDALLAAAGLREQRKDIEDFGKQIAAQEAASGAPASVRYDNVDLMSSMGDAHVTTLMDGEATRDHILKTIADVARQAKPEDALIVFYAGHGVAVGDRYYLLPQDLPFDGAPAELLTKGLDTLQRSGVSDLDLQSALAGEQAAVAALILDSCQSGELVGDNLAERRGPMDSRGLAQMAYDKRMFILAASLSTQTAGEQEALEHGVLTYALIQEGLIDDNASPRPTPMGPSLATLTEWLRWGANRVSQCAADTDHPRGFLQDERKIDAQWPSLQQPRLFAPPDSEGDVAVALRPINLDPETLTTAGYTESTPAAASPVAPPKLIFPASTLGAMHAGPVLASGHQMLGTIGNRIVALDLDHGAVLWRQPAGGSPISFDVSISGEIVALDQTGNVSIVNRSSTAAPKIIVPGFGFYTSGLVRWLKAEGEILVVRDKSIAVYDTGGKNLRSIELPNMGTYSPILSPAGDWLYLGDWSGKVLSFQVSSLTAGPVLANAPPPRSGTPIAAPYVASLVVDPAARHLIRIMNDGSFTEAQLPLLAPVSQPLIREGRIRAAAFSADGAKLFVASTTGTIEKIDTAGGGGVQSSWPAVLDSIETLSTDAQDCVLVASGSGGLVAWDLKDGKIRSFILGGNYFATATFSEPGTLDIELADKSKLRTFHLPGAQETSSAALPNGLYISQDRMLGKTAATLELWDPRNVSEAKQLPLPGDGRLNLTPDGRYLAWVAPQPGSGSIQVLETATGKTVRAVSTAIPVSAFALSPDGRRLNFLLADQLHVVPLSDLGPETIVPIAQAPCCIMVISADTDRLLLASIQGQIMLYDVASKRVVRSITEPFAITAAAFVPGGEQVVLATSDGEVLLWNPAATEAPRQLGSLEGNVLGITFSHSRSIFLVSTDRGNAGWFSLAANGGLLATTTWIESTQSWLTLCSDGRFSIAGNNSTLVGLMGAKEISWRPAAQQTGYTPGLLNELLAK